MRRLDSSQPASLSDSLACTGFQKGNLRKKAKRQETTKNRNETQKRGKGGGYDQKKKE